MTEGHGDNLLISNFDNRTRVDISGDFVSAFYITERYRYMPMESGYDVTVDSGIDICSFIQVIQQALSYARLHGMKVQINNPKVQRIIDARILNT